MSRTASLIIGPALSLGILAWLVGSHADNLLRLWAQADGFWLVLSFASAALSYVFLGAAHWEVLRLLGYRLRLRDVVAITTISQAVNSLVTTGGAAGTALRAHLQKRHGVPYGASLTVSVVWALCLNATLTLLLLQGFLLTGLRIGGHPIPWAEGAASLAGPLLVTFALAAAMFHHELRSRWTRRVFGALNRVVFLLSKGQIREHHFDEFDKDLTGGLRRIFSRAGHLTRTVGWVCGDWLLTLGVLDCAFHAFGIRLPLGPLILAFSLGIVATAVPLLPGGLGLMEGAMAGLLTRFGVEFDAALMAALAFRAFYFVGPLGASAALYPWLHAGRPAPAVRL